MGAASSPPREMVIGSSMGNCGGLLAKRMGGFEDEVAAVRRTERASTRLSHVTSRLGTRSRVTGGCWMDSARRAAHCGGGGRGYRDSAYEVQ